MSMEVIKWNAPPGVHARKWPSESLGTWSQLVVNESQEAILVKEGKMFGPIGPGRYNLNTKNIPLLEKFVGIPFKGKTPFTAEVWFVNKSFKLDIRWGTATPIQLRDPLYNIMLPIMARGQFGIAVKETKKFLKKLVGTQQAFTEDELRSYFKGIVLTIAKSAIAKVIVNDKVSILEISTQLLEISNAIESQVKTDFADYGLEVAKFRVISIGTNEEDHAVKELRKALAEKARMDILGTDFTQSRSFDVMERAAGNEGNAGGVLGAGLGMGMGVGMGVPMGNQMGNVAGNLDSSSPSAPTPGSATHCTNCGQENPPASNFCGGCGQSISRVCSKCSTKLDKSAKFCGNCGEPAGGQ